MEIIQNLGWGRIERLAVRNEEPFYACRPRIVQEIKISAGAKRRPVDTDNNLTLKQEFEKLFDESNVLGSHIDDFEVRKILPSKLAVEQGNAKLVQTIGGRRSI